MKEKLQALEPDLIYKLIIWSLLAVIIGILSGIASTAFLTSVNWAVNFRREHDWIIALLPLVGLMIAYVYNAYGVSIQRGNNLIIDEAHLPSKIIPFRMVPMIFISTVLGHLFGASIGREGAAVQMGAGISDQFSKILGKVYSNRKMILKMGMSAGFASVFGTPLAGAIFGFEVLFIGTIVYDALLPCLIAAIVGYYTAIVLGVEHVELFHVSVVQINAVGIFSSIIAGITFGYAAKLFVYSIKTTKSYFEKLIKNKMFHPFFGGIFVSLSYFIIGNDRYHSLGEEVIYASFVEKVYPWDFLGKIVMTTASVGSGFRGGEVMSLFYIGSTLGNTLSNILPMDFPMLAALGFVSVFAGAVNTPLTAVILAFEFFGSKIGVYASLSVFSAYLFSGREGIYNSQKTIVTKNIQ